MKKNIIKPIISIEAFLAIILFLPLALEVVIFKPSDLESFFIFFRDFFSIYLCLVFTFFYFFLKDNFFVKLKSYIYNKRCKNKSILENSYYYSYRNLNNLDLSFLGNKLHSEHSYAFCYKKYFLYGHELTFLNNNSCLSEIKEYLLSCPNYVNENEFFNYIVAKDLENIKYMLNNNQIELNYIHFLIASRTHFSIIDVFNSYITPEINSNLIKHIEKLVFSVIILYNNSSSLKSYEYFINLKNFDFNNWKSDSIRDLLNIFINFSDFKKCQNILSNLENIKFNQEETYDIFSSCAHNLSLPETLNIFSFELFSDNLLDLVVKNKFRDKHTYDFYGIFMKQINKIKNIKNF